MKNAIAFTLGLVLSRFLSLRYSHARPLAPQTEWLRSLEQHLKKEEQATPPRPKATENQPNRLRK